MIGLAAIGALLALEGASAPAALLPGPLEIRADSPAEETGTMHYAIRLTIRWKGSKAAPLELGGESGDPDVAASLLLPGPNFAIGGNRALLLGWSSVGAGLQEIHAVLIEKTHTQLSLADELHLQTDRASSALVVRRDASRWRLGIFEPEKIVFDEESWFLSCRAGSLDMRQIRRLRYVARDHGPADLLYDSTDKPVDRPGRVAWIEIGPKGFLLPGR